MNSPRHKIISLIILVSFILMSCAAHSPTVLKPADTANKADWLAYYKDQFKVHGKEVQVPDENATDVQRVAYNEAYDSWHKGQMVSLGIGGFALLIGLGSLLGTLSQM